MPAQVAFLRAVNVGHRQVKMDRLRALFASLGFADVGTHIASGNVWFTTRATGGRLEARIEAALEAECGFVVETFVRTIDELAALLEAVPFDADAVASAHALMICFLREPPSPAVARQVSGLSDTTDRFRVVGRELHWLRRVKESDPKLQKAVEQLLVGPMTGRNVKTVRRMAETGGGTG